MITPFVVFAITVLFLSRTGFFGRKQPEKKRVRGT